MSDCVCACMCKGSKFDNKDYSNELPVDSCLMVKNNSNIYMEGLKYEIDVFFWLGNYGICQ